MKVLQNISKKTWVAAIAIMVLLTACGVYSFKDVSIDYSKIKTVKIGFIENRARYVNPQLSPKLTDKLQQKIVSQTKLTRTNNDDASFIISGYVSDYTVSTTGVANGQSATNRLNVGAHITLVNTVENKTQEFDVNRNFDFAASLSIQQAEASLLEDIVKNMSDEIFNKIFSNW